MATDNLYTRFKRENREYYDRLYGYILFSFAAAIGLTVVATLLSAQSITSLVLVIAAFGGVCLVFFYEVERWPHKSAPLWLFAAARVVTMLATLMVMAAFQLDITPRLPLELLNQALLLPWQPVVGLALALEVALWVWTTVLFLRDRREVEQDWSAYAT